MKTTNLKNAFNCLLDGNIIQPLNSNGKIWIYNGYIFWQNFGRSAEKIKISELRWIFKTIFKNNDYTFNILLN
jgi:hypothetical protein